MISTPWRAGARFHLLEIAGNEASQIFFPICGEWRSASGAHFLWGVLGHLEEVVGIVFDDYHIYRGTSIRSHSRVSQEAYQTQRRPHKPLASGLRLRSVVTRVGVKSMQVWGQLTAPLGFWPTGMV